jgi:hypothetical protein
MGLSILQTLVKFGTLLSPLHSCKFDVKRDCCLLYRLHFGFNPGVKLCFDRLSLKWTHLLVWLLLLRADSIRASEFKRLKLSKFLWHYYGRETRSQTHTGVARIMVWHLSSLKWMDFWLRNFLSFGAALVCLKVKFWKFSAALLLLGRLKEFVIGERAGFEPLIFVFLRLNCGALLLNSFVGLKFKGFKLTTGLSALAINNFRGSFKNFSVQRPGFKLSLLETFLFLKVVVESAFSKLAIWLTELEFCEGCCFFSWNTRKTGLLFKNFLV